MTFILFLHPRNAQVPVSGHLVSSLSRQEEMTHFSPSGWLSVTEGVMDGDLFHVSKLCSTLVSLMGVPLPGRCQLVMAEGDVARR